MKKVQRVIMVTKSIIYKVSTESDQLKLKYYGKNKKEEYDIYVDGKINRLTGLKVIEEIKEI